jgi:hypothetical protein
MSGWLFENPVAVLFLVLFLAALGYLLWLRYRIAVSKARFGLTAVATMAACVTALLTFLSGPFPIQLINIASRALGLSSIATASDGPGWFSGILAFLSTLLALWLIYRFSIKALESWDGPITVNVNELAKREQDNNLALLAFAELRRLAQLREDPIASDAAVHWKQRQSEAPNTPAWHLFARDLFLAAYSEAQFADNGWRDRFQLWVGKIYVGHRLSDFTSLVLLVFEEEPTDQVIEERLDAFRADSGELAGSRIFAVFYEGTAKDIRIAKCTDTTVEILPRRFLLRKGLKLVGYARDLIRRFDVDPLGGTNATLKQTFVRAHVRQRGSDDRRILSAVVSDWLNDTSRKHLAITGEYGQGKSTAMLEICVRWAKRYLVDGAVDERIPLLVELRGQNPAETDPVAFLSAWSARYSGLVPQQLYNLIKAGEAIAIFEGFDELRNAGRAYDRHEHFNALWRMAFPGTKIIFTGRPNFFLDEKEKNRTLRADSLQGAGGSAFTELWELDRLTEEEVEQVASGFGTGLGASIMAAAQIHPAFFDIISRPSMLPVVATIWEKIVDLQAQGNDLTGAILIEYYLQAIYRRKEEEIERDRREAAAPDGASYLLLPREVREIFTLAIVWRMAGSDARNTISRRTFNAVINQIYDEVLKAFQKEGVAKQLIEQVRKFEERFKDESRGDRAERVSNEIASAGLFVSDPAGGPSNLRLPHKQFYEYMIAKVCWIILVHPASATAEILRTADSSKGAFDKMLSEDLPLGFMFDILGDDIRAMGTLNIKIYLAVKVLQSQLQSSVFYLTGPIRTWFGLGQRGSRYDDRIDTLGAKQELTFVRFMTSPLVLISMFFIVATMSSISLVYLQYDRGVVLDVIFLDRTKDLLRTQNFISVTLSIMLAITYIISRANNSRLIALRRLVVRRLRADPKYSEVLPLVVLYTECLRALTTGHLRTANSPETGPTGRTPTQFELQDMIAPAV